MARVANSFVEVCIRGTLLPAPVQSGSSNWQELSTPTESERHCQPRRVLHHQQHNFRKLGNG